MPTLAYWNTRGITQPIRLLLAYVEAEFDEIRYQQGPPPEHDKSEWLTVKEKLSDEIDFPNLPYYIDGDVKISQAVAILKHLARQYKLDGTTTVEKAKVDVLLQQEMDIHWNYVIRTAYDPNYENLKDELFKNVAPAVASLEKCLGDKPWFVGEKITVADFPLYELLDQLRLMKKDILDDHSKLVAFLDRFEALPTIKKYMTSDKFLKGPINNTQAGWGSTV